MGHFSIRPPAVAGHFYPDDPAELRRMVTDLAGKRDPLRRAIGVVVPHAGYVYSGGIAGHVFGSVLLPERFVILCPNHTGRGQALAINRRGAWRTPLGDAPVDSELAEQLMARFGLLQEDDAAHRHEHSLEVQLPFLQLLRHDVRFVPICVGTHDLGTLLALGEALADAVAGCAEPVMIVVSTDMTHYEPAERARAKDLRAVARIEALDAEGLHELVHREAISMCGIAPAVAGVAAVRRLGAERGDLLVYGNSGDVNGDFERVVGYAGMMLGPVGA